MSETPSEASVPVAIVGMSLRVPGARTLGRFWDNLIEGKDSLTRPDREELERAGVSARLLADPHFVAARPLLDTIEHFDAEFFGINAVQAAQTDPAHRNFLECVWEALEDGGVVPANEDHSIGVFAGVEGDYLYHNLHTTHDEGLKADIPKRLGNSMDYVALRVSHELNLTGPSSTSLATCATSLLAIHTAVQNLRLGECRAAIAGGSRVEMATRLGTRAAVDGMLSRSGRVRPFDSQADGTVFGDGTGVVVLKRLSDALADGNPIHGVILGTGFCNDGKPADKQSFIAPAASGQIRAIDAALRSGGIDPRTIGYVECHGTATLLGDPVEIAALAEVHRRSTDESQYCAISSVKGNLGHLGPAAGVVGLIKACLALKKGVVPPVANFEELNPHLDDKASPFFVADQPVPWEGENRPRRAAVSAFGFGGANAHVVVEQAPVREKEFHSGSTAPQTELLVSSARNAVSLKRRLSDLAVFLEENPETPIKEVARTLRRGREPMSHRAHLVIRRGDDVPTQLRAIEVTEKSGTGREVVFLFPGQGAQVPGMGRAFYESEPAYRDLVDYGANFLQRETGIDLLSLLFPAPDTSKQENVAALTKTTAAQPALFLVEYALSRILIERGLSPDAMLGHSLGEFVAATHAGIFSLEDALRIVALRSQLVEECLGGSMAAVLLGEEELSEILPSEIELAAVNFPRGCVVSGPSEKVESFLEELGERGIGHQRLNTSHAFHSSMLSPAEEKFREAMKGFKLCPPTRSIISNVTGRPLTDEEAQDPDYWARQMRQPVRFSDGLLHLLPSNPVFLELGPGHSLGAFVERHHPGADTFAAMEMEGPLEILGQAWEAGAEVSWPKDGGSMISLPTYPFQSRFHWRDDRNEPEGSCERHPLRLYEPGWTPRPARVAEEPIGAWIIFVDPGGFAEKIAVKLEESGAHVLRVYPSEGFEKRSESSFAVAPASNPDFERLLAELPDLPATSRLRVLHFWSLTGNDRGETDSDALAQAFDQGFDTLVVLVRAATRAGLASRVDIQVYADGMAEFSPATDVLFPEKGALIGPCLVIPQEVRGLTMRCLDVPGPEATFPTDYLLDEILEETRGDAEETLTALRTEGRFAEKLFDLREIDHGLPRLRYGGIVLITGGVGGLGLRFAEHLFTEWRARLVLTSRWDVPPRDQWDAYTDRNSKIGRALATLTRLEQSGAEILVVRADAANREDMLRVLTEAEKRFGGIHGVIHAAGILDPSTAFEKTRESARRVFNAKVESAFVIDELFRDRHLDLLVHFSSQSAHRPMKGQVDYSAANAVLDRLARRHVARGSGFACAIGWGAWRDAGMAWDTTRPDAETSSLFAEKSGALFSSTEETVDHPILKSCRRYQDGDALFSGLLRRGEHWVTEEHQVWDRKVISGTTIWEMFRAGFQHLHPSAESVELYNLAILEPFVVDEWTRYEVLYVQGGEGTKMELRILPDRKPEWIVISRGGIREIESETEVSTEIATRLEAVRDKKISPSAPLEHGPRWHCHWSEVEFGNSLATRVCLAEDFHHEIEDFGLHPAIFDRSIHFATEHYIGRKLPYTCDSMRVHGRIPAETLVHAHFTNDGDRSSFDFLITDRERNPLVKIRDYHVRAFDARRNAEWNEFVSAESGPVRRTMVLEREGAFDSFELVESPSPPVGPDEVRIEIKAAGLNFRDVLSALGRMPEGDETRQRIGSECSGIVEEVGAEVRNLKRGDRVVAITGECFGTETIAAAHTVTNLPESLSFVAGASLPLVFLTVDLALDRQARLQKGEKILIHAAAGGIGLAAVQFAQQVGAEVFATAGSEEKRDYLRHLGVEHVMDSRSLDFVDEVRRITNGEGVDVVLNALAGEYITASLELLKPFGRFVEIGKRDIYENFQLGLLPFRNNLSYVCVDLGQFSVLHPVEFQNRLESLMQKFATGIYQPVPVKTFALDEIADGFRYMAQAQHIGKIVFEVDSGRKRSARERFQSEYGNGIRVRDGLRTFTRLISSNDTPPCVVAIGDTLGAAASAERHLSQGTGKQRPVDTEYRSPETPDQEVLQQIWEKTLGVSPVGIDDDFVELGGDSINAIMVQVAMEQHFGLDLPFSVLFKHPTIAKLGEAVAELRQDR